MVAVSRLAGLGDLIQVARISGQSILLPAPSVDDAELVLGALDGDSWSREALYRRHAGHLLAVSTRLLSNRSEAEEVVQDTFLIAYRRLRTLREPAAVRGWLTKIAVSLVRRRLRRARLLRFLQLDRPTADAALEVLAGPALLPDQRAELALFDDLLRSMRADLRIAWMLRRVEGFELTEIAATCGCSLATIKRKIAQADAIIEQHTDVQQEGG
jgi:RNA polymerase sigma-70 factor (ECF subfamily)